METMVYESGVYCINEENAQFPSRIMSIRRAKCLGHRPTCNLSTIGLNGANSRICLWCLQSYLQYDLVPFYSKI